MFSWSGETSSFSGDGVHPVAREEVITWPKKRKKAVLGFQAAAATSAGAEQGGTVSVRIGRLAVVAGLRQALPRAGAGTTLHMPPRSCGAMNFSGGG